MLNSKRLTIFCGHYGSGKTNAAVNYALALRKEGCAVAAADLDVVNPYFRTADSRAELEAAGVRVLTLPYANTSVDLPVLPSEMYSLVQGRTEKAVLDVGGDDRGALALGRFVPAILEENDYDMLYVVNFFRPLTADAEAAMEVLREIEFACGLRFTGIVHNSNLGPETTADTIRSKVPELERLEALSGLPLRFTAAAEPAASELKISPLLRMTLQRKPTDA